MIALGYILDDGDEDHVAWQRAEIARRSTGMVLERWWTDRVKDSKRPNLRAALKMIEDGSAERIIVATSAHLAPRLEELATLVSSAQFIFAADEINLDTPTGQVWTRWLDKYVTNSARFAPSKKRVKRRWSGKVPYGFRRSATGELTEDPAEQATLERIYELHEAGHSFRQIATTLESENHSPRGGKWHPPTISRIIARK